MSKNPKPAATNKPQSVQLDAIRRLAHQGKLLEARARVKALRQRFPDHRPLLALAWEVEDEAGSPWAAAARAFDWAQASPGSAAALSTLAESAFAIDLVALGAAAFSQLAVLNGKPADSLPAVETPLGPMSGEEAVQVDLSRLLMMDGRYDEIIERLRDASHPSLLNNRALAYFAKGDVARAHQEFEDNWQHHPLNLFALERLVRLRMWRQGRNYAAGLAAPLQATVPARAEDAFGKLNGLILLGEWNAAETSWRADSTAHYWHAGDNLLRGRFDYAGAVVALRDGNRKAARERLHLAGNASSNHEPIFDLDLALLSASEPGGYVVEIGELAAWFPISWYSRLRDLRDARKSVIEVQMRSHFAACDAHADYLGLAVELGGKTAGVIATEILKQRATQGDHAAKEQLVSLLSRPCGPDSYRTRLSAWLSEEKMISSDSPVPMLANGQVTQIKPFSFRLMPEPTRSNPYSPAVQERYERMSELLSRERLQEALAEASEVRRLAPEVPMSHANLALVKEALGDPDKDVEPLFRQALALDESYIFARAGLTRVLARRGDVDAAKAMLEPVFFREEYHFAEWRTILLAQREMALARGESIALKTIDRSLLDLQEMARR